MGRTISNEDIHTTVLLHTTRAIYNTYIQYTIGFFLNQTGEHIGGILQTQLEDDDDNGSYNTEKLTRLPRSNLFSPLTFLGLRYPHPVADEAGKHKAFMHAPSSVWRYFHCPLDPLTNSSHLSRPSSSSFPLRRLL